MPRPPRPVLLARASARFALFCVVLVGCSAVTDFDRDKLATSVDHQQTRDGGGNGHEDDMDGAVGAEGGGANPATDTGLVADEGSVIIDDDATVPLQCNSHAECPRNRLCCGGTCVATSSEARCTDCEAACIATSANACNDRVCGCGANGACTGDKKYCTGSGRNAVCAQCRDANDCEGHADGRTQCIQGNCAACDPANNGGCMGNTPICNPTTFTCEACKASPDNCPGNSSVCTASGACGGCTANDAADCTSPTAPICNLAVNPSMCRGCMSDTECMTELSRPYCVGNQRCAICNPTNDMGCVATSGTPDCRLNTNGTYQCQACSSTSCATGQRCDTASGKCVQCRNDDDCDSNSATPYCDTAMGVCRACTAVTGIGANAWCSLNTLLSLVQRPVCHTTGRCVRCDANNAGVCNGTTPRCYVPDVSAPQNNACVACRPGVAADCTGATPICNASTRVCRGCATNTEMSDCPTAAAPACNASTGACVRCRLGMRGAAAQCGANQVCVMGTSGPECGQCERDTDCPVAAPLCNTTTHQCRACTPGTDNGACGAKTTGTICVTGGTCARCDTTTQAPCAATDQLCCPAGGGGDGPSCVARNAMHCASCTNTCTGTTPACQAQINMCGCTSDSCGAVAMCVAGLCVPVVVPPTAGGGPAGGNPGAATQ